MNSTYKELVRILGTRLDPKKVARVADTVLQWAQSTPEDLTPEKILSALDFVSGSLEIHIPDSGDRSQMLSQLKSIS